MMDVVVVDIGIDENCTTPFVIGLSTSPAPRACLLVGMPPAGMATSPAALGSSRSSPSSSLPPLLS